MDSTGFSGHASRLLNERINEQHTHDGRHPNARSNGTSANISASRNGVGKVDESLMDGAHKSNRADSSAPIVDIKNGASIRGRKKTGLIVYPPCNSAHNSLPLDQKQRKFVAVAQFRYFISGSSFIHSITWSNLLRV
jgi:hypothetical protein